MESGEVLAALARRVSLLVVVGVLAFAPSALAQGGSSEETYGGEAGNVQQAVDPGGPGGTGEVSDPGALPFSGLDVVLMLGGAVVLVATGAGVSRLVSRRQTA